MARLLKIGPPVLLILALLSSCGSPAEVEIFIPGTADPTNLAVYQDQSTHTPKPTQDQGSPETTNPTPTTTQKSCQQSAGTVQAYEIPWDDTALIGQVYLPPCYTESDQRYPTLYLLHGATKTEEHWKDLGLFEVVDDLISREKIPPLIIVMPREDTWIELSENYFGDHLIQAVIPWIDAEYRTLAEREYRAIGGISRGGNWAIRLGLLNWETFGSLGGHSSPLFYLDFYRLPTWLENIPRESIPRIYLDTSEGDTHLSETEALQGFLVKKGVSHEWHLYPGLHNDSYWSSHLEEYLLWYSSGWSDQ